MNEKLTAVSEPTNEIARISEWSQMNVTAWQEQRCSWMTIEVHRSLHVYLHYGHGYNWPHHPEDQFLSPVQQASYTRWDLVQTSSKRIQISGRSLARYVFLTGFMIIVLPHTVATGNIWRIPTIHTSHALSDLELTQRAIIAGKLNGAIVNSINTSMRCICGTAELTLRSHPMGLDNYECPCL